MEAAPAARSRPKLVLANHFGLGTICGTTVMFVELFRIASRAAPDADLAYQSYEPHTTAADLCASLDAAHADASCVVAVNAHIEVSWELTEALFGWCLARGIPAYVWAHDYWPHHKENVHTLTTRFGARLLASTPFVAETLVRDGFSAEVIGVGVPLPDDPPPPRTPASSAEPASPKVIASAGRLVPRKRLPDIARAFAESGLDGQAQLYLRVLPSQVFDAASDVAQLAEIEAEIARAHLASVVLDRQPGERPDYATYSVYVCSSSYEGFSMTVIESAFHGCPALMSEIPPHQRTARALYGERAGDFLYPVGDHAALAALLRDEITTGRRRALLDARIDEMRATIRSLWSLDETARSLAALAARARDVIA